VATLITLHRLSVSANNARCLSRAAVTALYGIYLLTRELVLRQRYESEGGAGAAAAPGESSGAVDGSSQQSLGLKAICGVSADAWAASFLLYGSAAVTAAPYRALAQAASLLCCQRRLAAAMNGGI